jgi:prepilin-type N-terminal cleavage/methylation domain-containing protein
MSHVNRNKQSGFTLIELSLAMAFISILLVAIALIIIQITGIYNRGITLKEVNQAGRTVSTELQDGIGAALPFSIVSNDDTVKSAYLVQNWGGALCMGEYSYIWNNGKDISDAINSGNFDNLNIYSDVANTIDNIPHFIKIYDPDRSFCVQNDGLKINNIQAAKSTELLATGQVELVIHSLDISTVSDASSFNDAQQLYDISLVIGTNNRNALLPENDVADSCKPPSGFGADTTYCSVQHFHIVARAGSSN